MKNRKSDRAVKIVDSEKRKREKQSLQNVSVCVPLAQNVRKQPT